MPEVKIIEKGKDYEVRMTYKDGKPLVKCMDSPEANYRFHYDTGLMISWGKTAQEDPIKYPAPTILDMEITTVCKHGCPFCFPAGTLISTKEGVKPIEEIKEGDWVKSRNLETNRPRYNEVLETYKRDYTGVLITLELENGQKVTMTPNHPVYVKDVGWVEAQNLTSDMEVITT